MNAIVLKGALKGHEVEIVEYEGRKVRVKLLREARLRVRRSSWDCSYSETVYCPTGQEMYVLKTSIKEVDEEERLLKKLKQVEAELRGVRTFKLIKSKGRPGPRERKEILENIEI